jgi:hypothetical protein
MSFTVKVNNEFAMARRDILVRRKSFEGTMEEQQVSGPTYKYGDEKEEGKGRTVKLSLGEVDGVEDYLEISVDNQKEELGPCKIDIRSYVPVTFIPPAAASVTVIPPKDVETLETNTSLRIPSGLPTWKLEIRRPSELGSDEGDREGTQVNVRVSDDTPGEGGLVY